MFLQDKLAAFVTTFVLMVPLLAQHGGHRTIQYAPNRTISERLLPDDQVVTVYREYNYRVIVPEPVGADIVEDLMRTGYGTVLVVDVAHAAGVLVDDGGWIRTRFEGTVVETLANLNNPLRRTLEQGSQVTFSSDGGELRLGKVRVKTMNSVSYSAPARYLVVLGPLVDDSDHQSLGTDPVLVRGNLLVAVTGSATKLARATLDDVRQVAGKVRPQ